MEQLMKCAYCKFAAVTIFQKVNKKYTLYFCSLCSLIFTFPETKEPLRINKSRYDSQEELDSRIANFAKEYQSAKNHVLAFMKYKKKGKYLDIGCSYGIALKAARDLGFDVTGIEPTKKASDYARKTFHVKIIQKTLEKSKLKNNTYDVVSLYDVLEHVPNLKIFLKEIYRILKPNGLLVIQSPNIESYAYSLLKISWNWLLVPNHLWHFSKKSITKLLGENGFNVINFTTQDNVYDFSSNLNSKIFLYKRPKNLSEKIYQKFTYILCYSAVYLGTKMWSYAGKGGTLQIYAEKK